MKKQTIEDFKGELPKVDLGESLKIPKVAGLVKLNEKKK
jgi:hypothetical protein